MTITQGVLEVGTRRIRWIRDAACRRDTALVLRTAAAEGRRLTILTGAGIWLGAIARHTQIGQGHVRMSVEEQKAALIAGGYSHAGQLMLRGGMVLRRAV